MQYVDNRFFGVTLAVLLGTFPKQELKGAQVPGVADLIA
jgi:hypothetical protein